MDGRIDGSAELEPNGLKKIDVYTTDSCGESSPAESVDAVAAAAVAAATTSTAGEKRLARRTPTSSSNR